MLNRRNEIKEINLDAFEFIAKQNQHIAIATSLIFITLIFSVAALAGICYRLDAIKHCLGI